MMVAEFRIEESECNEVYAGAAVVQCSRSMANRMFTTVGAYIGADCLFRTKIAGSQVA